MVHALFYSMVFMLWRVTDPVAFCPTFAAVAQPAEWLKDARPGSCVSALDETFCGWDDPCKYEL